jgi:DNA repair and recombination protein RAD52
MTFTEDQIAMLDAPLSKAVVKKNPKGFDYVEAWHAISEANRIFGFDAWNRETVEMRLLGEPRQTGETWRVGYFAKVRITVGDVVREGCGFGSGINRDVDQAHEGALKEAESDAMKRALMTFGNPFGLALYDKTQANVESAPAAQSRPRDAAPPARNAAPAEPSAAVAAATAAISMCATSAVLKAWWEEHKDQINALPDPEYLAISEVMRAKTAELKPKAKPATREDFGLNGDQVPAFN